MSFMSFFNSEVNLETMSEEERVVYFKQQAKKADEMAAKMKKFISRAISLAEIVFGPEARAIIKKWRPLVEAVMQNPEQVVDVAGDAIEALCKKANIPSHFVMISWTKPAAIDLGNGKIVANKDIQAELRVYNPNLDEWISIPWNIRHTLRASANPQLYDDTFDRLSEAHHRKPVEQKQLV